MREPTKAAIIGSGFGGLAAAVRLRAAGFDVDLYEALDRPGGRAYVFEEDGFVFDAGPTVITAPRSIEEVFEAAGRRLEHYVELIPIDPFYRLEWGDGDRFDYVGDPVRMAAQIGARNPADVEGYRRFLRYAEKVFDKGYTELAATPFLRFWDMVRVTPALIRLRADRSIYRTVASFVSDERVRQALSFHALLLGGNPFDTSAIYTLIHHLERAHGVYFPRGGTGALVRAFVRVFEELGGRLHLECPVTSVVLEEERGRVRHRVCSARGDMRYDVVISNADLSQTYGRLYASHPHGRKMMRHLERRTWSMSLFVLYFGTDRTYPDVAHHTVIFGARYRDLLREIFDGPGLPEDHSLYLHAPTVTDPSLAPPSCATFYVLSPVPNLGRARIDWDREAPRYAERILTALEAQLPDLRRHVIRQRVVTPNYFRDVLGAYEGAAFSVAPTLAQSAYFRPHNKDPAIPGLYLVGAGTHPGAGVPGVINSAKGTVSLVLADEAAKRGAAA